MKYLLIKKLFGLWVKDITYQYFFYLPISMSTNFLLTYNEFHGKNFNKTLFSLKMLLILVFIIFDKVWAKKHRRSKLSICKKSTFFPFPIKLYENDYLWWLFLSFFKTIGQKLKWPIFECALFFSYFSFIPNFHKAEF